MYVCTHSSAGGFCSFRILSAPETYILHCYLDMVFLSPAMKNQQHMNWQQESQQATPTGMQATVLRPNMLSIFTSVTAMPSINWHQLYLLYLCLHRSFR